MGDDLAASEAFLALIQRNPRAAADELERSLAGRGRGGPGRCESHRLLALAHLRTGDARAARLSARRAVRCASSRADRTHLASARITYATTLSATGAHDRAAAEALRAIEPLRGESRSMALVELGLIHQRAGRLTDALQVSERAARRLAESGRATGAAGARLNCAVMRMLAGDPTGALADLELAQRLVDAGAEVPAWLLMVNRAHALTMCGDVLRGLELFDEGAQEMMRAGFLTRQLELDQLHALLRAGASLEVMQRTRRMRVSGRFRGRERAELDLLDASAARQALSWQSAARHAGAARRRFRGLGDEHGWARSVALQAEVQLAGGARRPRAGAVDAARAAAVVAGDAALERRLLAVTARLAPPAAAQPALPRRRSRTGDVATDLAVEVARIERAAREGRDGVVLRSLADLLAWRQTLAARAATAQMPDGSSVGFADAVAIALRFGLHRDDPVLLARLTGIARALAAPAPASAFTARAFVRDATQVDFVSAGFDVWRVVTRGERATGYRVGPRDVLVRLGRLSRSERAMSLRPGRAPVAADESLRQLDALLFASGEQLGTDLLLTYPAALAAIPWAALPTLARRTWAVAAATAAELMDATPARASSSATVIVGPDVPNGDDEAQAALAHYPRARLLDGSAATVGRTQERLAAPGVVHIAAHAGRRGDDPTLSWIDLADGRLTCRELLRTPIRSDCVVLAACDAAAPAGDTAAGVVTPATTMLGMGAGAVIGPIEPVEHEATTAFLTTVHHGLARRLDPAQALAEARAAHADTSAALSFVCLVATAA